MNFFIVVFWVCLPLAFIDILCEPRNYKIGDKRRKILSNFCFWMMCAVIMFTSLFRHPYTGTDAFNNYQAYINILNDSPYINYEFGYVYYVKWIQTLSENYIFFLRICTGIILLPIMWMVNKMPYRSLIMLCFILGELNATFDVIKGFIAFAFVIIGCYMYYFKKNKVGFIVLCMSVCFHATSIFYAMLFILASMIKKQKTYWIISAVSIIFAATPLLNVTINMFANLLSLVSIRFSNYIESYGTVVDFSPTYVIVYLVPNILGVIYFKESSLWVRKREEANNENIKINTFEKIMMNLNYLMLILTFMSTWIPVLHRFLKLSLIFNYILIALCVNKERKQINRVVIIILAVVVNFIFAIVNNQGFNFEFYFNSSI